MTVYENVALSPRLRGIKNKAELDVIVQRCPDPGGPLGRGQGIVCMRLAACFPAASSSA
ncbi:hypothetical protein [Candidatus Accumulibacter sp. ACC007]|uniref:hypothetical protein n=1 Tax=Candidatus Accumulibacter sp. ACC007 TaxID=2823333 RepID=UPI0025BD1643|nr:hypothetical protein [Candidatus Accumulibacter sp. ACC007]